MQAYGCQQAPPPCLCVLMRQQRVIDSSVIYVSTVTRILKKKKIVLVLFRWLTSCQSSLFKRLLFIKIRRYPRTDVKLVQSCFTCHICSVQGKKCKKKKKKEVVATVLLLSCCQTNIGSVRLMNIHAACCCGEEDTCRKLKDGRTDRRTESDQTLFYSALIPGF